MSTSLSLSTRAVFTPRQTFERRRGFACWLAALIAMLAWLFQPASAHAGANIKLSNAAPEERDGRWKLSFTIDYGKVPHLAHMPMTFSFEQTMVYLQILDEKNMTEPRAENQPMRNQQAINLQMDVGFSDGSKTYAVTKYDFSITRDKGFECGEYKLTLIDSDGKKVGSPVTVKLMGKNPSIDRRPITFVGDTGKAPKKAEPPPAGSADPSPSSEPAPAASSEAAAQEPPKAPPKQGGCGCELTPASPSAGLWALAPLAALALRRRRPR
jgi:MYXO-CTERM domain-containing protein